MSIKKDKYFSFKSFLEVGTFDILETPSKFNRKGDLFSKSNEFTSNSNWWNFLFLTKLLTSSCFASLKSFI